MKRRSFLRAASAMAVPVILPTGSFMAMPKSGIFSGISDESDRILVLVQLNGGNDGLHTVIPVEFYRGLALNRPNFVIPETSILDINDSFGFHPNMVGMKNLYDNEKMHVIQGVAYPNQNRSHFRSTDIWQTASDANEFLTTGWMGRYFDDTVDGYPEGYPNEEYPHPFALSIGTFVSETCQGTISNYSLATTGQPSQNNDDGDGDGIPDTVEDDGTFYSYELNFLKRSLAQADAYGAVLDTALEAGNNMADYPDGNRLANQLSIVARLISGGLQTKVYVVSLGGFDTHANQIVAGDSLNGEHATLLQQLSDAISAFQSDLELMDVHDRVLGMTYSEFGRQIKNNLSFGTDHGTAAPLFVFGSCVQPGFTGEQIDLPTDLEPGAGVPMQYDFRSIYGTVLVDWFKADESSVRNYIFPDYQHLPILKECSITVSNEDTPLIDPVFNVFPNPAQDYTKVTFDLMRSAHVRVSVSDVLGRELILATGQKMDAGIHEMTLEIGSLPTGTYYVRVQADAVQKVRTIIKL